MERRNRTILVVLTAIVIVVAIFSSFGLSLVPRQHPEITVPTPIPSGSQTLAPGSVDSSVIWVEVTPHTVQSVIETLPRQESYYREISIYYSGAAGSTSARVWADGGWTRTETINSRTGLTRYTLVNHETLYYWYSGDRDALQAPADEKSPDLDGVHIPTYQDVLDLDKSLITDAGYVEKEGLPCVYVAVEDAELNQRQRYWISVDNGLLMAAEITRGEEVLMSMSSTSPELPVPPGTMFTLPGGTVLHTAA